MNFRGCFVAWSGERGVNSPAHIKSDRVGLVDNDILQSAGIHRGKIREARTESIIVWADQRIHADQVYVIRYYHQRAGREFSVERPGGIRQDKCPHSQKLQYANRERHFLERVSFVKMETPLHRRNRNVVGLADYEPACVTLDCGSRK